MTAAEYQRERRLRGTQAQVARMLEITASTLTRRESGQTPISEEMARALFSIPAIFLSVPREELEG